MLYFQRHKLFSALCVLWRTIKYRWSTVNTFSLGSSGRQWYNISGRAHQGGKHVVSTGTPNAYVRTHHRGVPATTYHTHTPRWPTVRVVPGSNSVDHGQQNALYPLRLRALVTGRSLCVTRQARGQRPLRATVRVPGWPGRAAEGWSRKRGQPSQH